MKSSELISQRALNLAGSPTLDLLSRVKALQAQGKQVLEYYIGEPDFGIPPNVAAAIKDAIEQGKTMYTHQAGIPELREAMDCGRLSITAAAMPLCSTAFRRLRKRRAKPKR